VSPWTTLSFEGSPVNSLPLNWQQYNSDSDAQVAVAASPNPALNSTQSLSVASGVGSGDVSRAWLDETMPADVQVSADVYISRWQKVL
jgi:hypothetical protein